MEIFDQGTRLVQTMQAAIAPVTLISGVGLLILSMTNRFGRVIDRSRDLLKQLSDHDYLRQQLQILYLRARVMRSSIGCGVGSIFCTSITIFLLFIQLYYGNHLSGAAQFSFIAALLLLIIGMGLYLWDIRLSLKALELEIRAVDQTATPKSPTV